MGPCSPRSGSARARLHPASGAGPRPHIRAPSGSEQRTNWQPRKIISLRRGDADDGPGGNATTRPVGAAARTGNSAPLSRSKMYRRRQRRVGDLQLTCSAVSRNRVALCDGYGALVARRLYPVADAVHHTRRPKTARGPVQGRAEERDAHETLPKRLRTVRPPDLDIARSQTTSRRRAPLRSRAPCGQPAARQRAGDGAVTAAGKAAELRRQAGVARQAQADAEGWVMAQRWHSGSCVGLCRVPTPYADESADLRGFRQARVACRRFRGGEGTANAVWVRAHPGFKSPSLRS